MPRACHRFDSPEAAYAWANRNKATEKQPVPRLVASEEEEQMALIARVRLHEHTYPALKMLFHCPNGGKRHIVEAKKFKALGVLAGIPDLILLHPARNYHGWLGEIKALDGTPTTEQKRIIIELKRRGYCAEIYYGQDAAWESLLWYVKGEKHGI